MDLNLLARGGHNDFSTARGFVFGIGAFLVGYLIVLLAAGDRTGDLARVAGGESGPEAFQVTGWVFYSAHQVTSGVTTATSSETLPIQGSLLWEPWFFLVPVVVLVATGFLIAWAARAIDGFNGVMNGAAVVIGYLPAVVVANFLFSYTTPPRPVSASVGPNLFLAAMLAGIAYPVIAGGLGGVIAAMIRS